MASASVDWLIGYTMTTANLTVKGFSAGAMRCSAITATAGTVAHLQRVLRHQVSKKSCPHSCYRFKGFILYPPIAE